MNKYLKISLVGSGNVAWHLSQAFENYGHSVVEISGRNSKNTAKLVARLYEATAKNDLDFSESIAEVIVIAVSDKAIASVVEEIKIPANTIIVHTSGTESINVFEDLPNPCGVFYPVQTFSKERQLDFKSIPFSIEASDDPTKNILFQLSSSISKKVHYHSTEQRRIIHLAAVFAANFTNHMLTISKGLLESNQISFDMVKPLIAEVVNKALLLNPENSQTGPAIRNDFSTIQKHLGYLSEEEGLTRIYQAITDDIIRTYEE